MGARGWIGASQARPLQSHFVEYLRIKALFVNARTMRCVVSFLMISYNFRYARTAKSHYRSLVIIKSGILCAGPGVTHART